MFIYFVCVNINKFLQIIYVYIYIPMHIIFIRVVEIRGKAVNTDTAGGVKVDGRDRGEFE